MLGLQWTNRVDFDRCVRVEFRGAQISSHGGFPRCRSRPSGAEYVRGRCARCVTRVYQTIANGRDAHSRDDGSGAGMTIAVGKALADRAKKGRLERVTDFGVARGKFA